MRRTILVTVIAAAICLAAPAGSAQATAASRPVGALQVYDSQGRVGDVCARTKNTMLRKVGVPLGAAGLVIQIWGTNQRNDATRELQQLEEERKRS